VPLQIVQGSRRKRARFFSTHEVGVVFAGNSGNSGYSGYGGGVGNSDGDVRQRKRNGKR
jgi:hypothetical protein